MHRLPFPDNYKRSNSISTVPMSVPNVNVCIFDPPSQLRTDFVGYTSRTAEVGTGPLSPGHGDRGLVANLMSSHRAATLLVRNRIVTSARPRAITCCGGHSDAGGDGRKDGRVGMCTNIMARRHSDRWASPVDKRDVGGVYLVRHSPQVGEKRYVKIK